MTTLTAEQHTALLDALDALEQKSDAAHARYDFVSARYLFKQYHVIRDLLDNATIEEGDAA